MKLVQAKGNTWYLSGWQYIPIYMVDDSHCILLDGGYFNNRKSIERTLAEAGIEMIGVIATHAHTDHAGNIFYFQRKYGIPSAMPVGEMALCIDAMALKVNFFVFSYKECCQKSDVNALIGKADVVIGPEDKTIEFCGVPFDIIRLPGHSADQIGIRTLDNVLYVADAIMAGKDLELAKLPYHLSLERAMETMEQLRQEKADLYLMAHKAVRDNIDDLITENIKSLNEKCQRITGLIDRPMTLSQVQQMILEDLKLLTSDVRKAELYERCIRSYVEYLCDKELIQVHAKGGMIYYAPHEAIMNE